MGVYSSTDGSRNSQNFLLCSSSSRKYPGTEGTNQNRRWHATNNLMFFSPCIMNWLYINYQLWCTDYYLFIKYYSALHVLSLKCSCSGGYSCTCSIWYCHSLWQFLLACQYTAWVRTLTQAVYRQATKNSHREWQYHMLHVYNCILLNMSTWGSKHVEENSILWINNNQCIKVGN